MKKNYKNLLLGVLIFGIISLIVAFAALSTNLNINGTAKVSSQRFKVVIDDWTRVNNVPSLVNGQTNSAAEITAATVTANTMTISGLSVSLPKSGDVIKYSFNIENQGTFDATLSTFSIGTPVCTNTTTGTSTACPSLTYEIKCGSPLSVPTQGDVLAAGATLPCTYTLGYNEVESGTLNQQAITITGLTASWAYQQ